jgi:hypothetical protein
MRVDQDPVASSGYGATMMPESTVHLRRSAADSIEELIGATSVLRTELNAHEATCRKVLDEVRVDHAITGVLPQVQADTWRSAVTDAIRGFEAARHRVRLLLVAIEVEEGRSIGEVARSWGVSRQLASRWVQESAGLRR